MSYFKSREQKCKTGPLWRSVPAREEIILKKGVEGWILWKY
jgi:hypothetical protein